MIDIYLACPYSDPDPAVRQQRFEQVNAFAAKLMAEGLTVFSPISHAHSIALAGDLPKGWDFWERYDREFLAVCETLVVLRLSGWAESKGIREEIQIAFGLRHHWRYAEPDVSARAVRNWFECVKRRG